MDSRLRGNDRIKDWIPAYAESTPPSTPLGYNNIRGGSEQKSSGGNDGGGRTKGTVPLAPALLALQCTWR